MSPKTLIVRAISALSGAFMKNYDTNSKNSNSSLRAFSNAPGIPCIISKEFLIGPGGISWKFSFYQEAEELFDEDIIRKEFSFLNSLKGNGFRKQIHFRTVPFLVGILPEKKQIYFLSPKAHRENFVLANVSKGEFNPIENEAYEKWKKHTEEVLKLNLYDFPTIIDQVSAVHKLENLNDPKYLALNEKINQSRYALTKNVEEYRSSIFEKVSDYGLTLTANYDLIRIHLLKFVAILASLEFDKKGTEVKRILLESLRRLLGDSTKAQVKKLVGTQKALPKTLWCLFYVIQNICTLLPAKVLCSLVKFAIRGQAKRFIAGETIEKAENSLKELIRDGRDATLDQLGELVVSKKEADHYKNEVIKLIKGFSNYVNEGEKNRSGIYRAHVSIKISALSNDFNPTAFDHTYESVKPRLKEILVTAKKYKVFINIDAEHFHYRDMVLDIYSQVLQETDELQDYTQTGIVLQGYLRDAYLHLEKIIALAKNRNIIMPIRLVKGAYWDAETVEADAHSFDAPEFLNKEETDIHYRQLIIEILKNYPYVQLCLGGHNLRDHCFAEVVREEFYPKTPVIEHQCLHMTFEALSVGMNRMGWVSRNYVPIGSLLVGMAYLVRRIMENSSQVGVLTQMRSHKNYEMIHPQTILEKKKEKRQLAYDKTITAIGDRFSNVAPVKLYLPEEKIYWKKSLELMKLSLGKKYENKFLLKGEEVFIHSSSDPSLLVGKIDFATVEDARKAIEISEEEFSSGDWFDYGFERRGAILQSVASELLCRRLELSALIVYEAGKSQEEALADVDEAIDFLNYYSRLGKVYGEKDPRGVTCVISPWNFPLAIPCGMVSGPLVSGNTVILKSAEQTPLIAQVLVDIFHRSGVPRSALIHLPGEGETVGDFLVNSPKISTIVFTGSKAVGTYIMRMASKRIYKNPRTGQEYPVRAITEMGGKNAILVTANAEMDETVEGILYSAFAHAGQKCSACSRVIVDNRVKNILIERLKEATLDIEVGEAYEEKTVINPLISKDSFDRIISQSRKITLEAKDFGGKVHVDRTGEDYPGHAVGPMLIELPFNRGIHKDSFSQKELFAPIIHIIGFDNKEEALTLFNATEYGLTGGIFSQSQDDIDFFTENMKCGNIYVNRGNTGARVGIEPFGGFKLSGTGPKAGTHYYLQSFLIDFIESNSNREFSTVDSKVPKPAGSDYDFDLSVKNQLNIDKRIERFRKGISFFYNQFEDIFQGIYPETKSIILEYLKWVNNDFYDFATSDRPNVTIPGQLSFDRYSMTKEKIVFSLEEDIPSTSTLLSFFTALSAGVGITIITTKQETYLIWQRIIDCFYSAGVSKMNLSANFCSPSRYEEVIRRKEIEMFFNDGDRTSFKLLSNKIFEKDFESDFLPKVLSTLDSPDPLDFESFYLQFIEIRSFAINTMRHGAPLEINL